MPGIGKKTAERLLLELKGKLGADLGACQAPLRRGDPTADIIHALLALGYNEQRGARRGAAAAGGQPARRTASASP